MKRLILLVVLAIFVAGCVQQSVDVKSCSYDADCVKVDAGCCGCNAGGKATAINKNFVGQWNANLTENCGEIACAMFISDDPSCFAEPKCINYKCELVQGE